MKTLFDEEEETFRWQPVEHGWSIPAVDWPIQWRTESPADIAWRDRAAAAIRAAIDRVNRRRDA